MAFISTFREFSKRGSVLHDFLSREGQTAWSKASGFPSLRQDVPRDHVVPMLIPKEGVRYQEQYSERFVEIRRETVNFIKTVINR